MALVLAYDTPAQRVHRVRSRVPTRALFSLSLSLFLFELAMETLQQDLFAELARLPPQSNPYEFIDQFLVEKISPRRPKSFELQLVICMVAHGM